MLRTVLRTTLPATLAALALIFTAGAAGAAVYIPTKTADTDDGHCDADCSLREAILAANANPGADVILLKAGTYALTRVGAGEDAAATGDLDILDDLTLLGDGAGSTIIDGLAQDRVLQVAAGQTADLRGVQLRHGSASGAGGAILNAGTLTFTQGLLSDNVASTAGGAIENTGTLHLSASALIGNQAGTIGGGMHASGPVELVNVTVAANVAKGGYGGGVYMVANTAATLNNVTLARNQSVLQGGGLFVESSAFIGQNAARVSNSIIAQNTAGSEADCSGAPLSGGHNLVGSGAGCGDFAAAKSDLVGTGGAAVDPLLDVIGNFGGPTPTIALLASSPAKNAGSTAGAGAADACAAADQRGATRPAGGRCDIGAFEVTDACVAGGNTLCLNNGRFKVTATFTAPTGSGDAQGVTLTPDTGYLWFFDPGNVEATIKVLNGCAVNNHYWVFLSGLTNVAVSVKVTDTKTGTVKPYTNPPSTNFRPQLDTSAFATCP
jgi:CSLREA domain-containing protein